MGWNYNHFVSEMSKRLGLGKKEEKPSYIRDMQRLVVKDGDVVIVHFDNYIGMAEYKRVENAFAKAKEHMKVDFKIIIIEGKATIGVLGRQEGK